MVTWSEALHFTVKLVLPSFAVSWVKAPKSRSGAAVIVQLWVTLAVTSKLSVAVPAFADGIIKKLTPARAAKDKPVRKPFRSVEVNIISPFFPFWEHEAILPCKPLPKGSWHFSSAFAS
ncbi:hypothetical protein [Thermosynechococcus sp. FA-CM-4201]